MVTLAIVAPLGWLTVLADQLVVHRMRGLRHRFAAVALLSAALLAAAVALFVALMFVSGHDAFMTVLLAAYAAALAWWTAARLGRSAMDDLDRVRDTLAAVGAGRRDVRTGVEGEDEIAQLAADVDAMVARLDHEERMRRTLFAAVSHDLRTPVTALRLLANALDDDVVVDGEQRREYVARMGTHVRALGTLIDDLFELTRLQSGELEWTDRAGAASACCSRRPSTPCGPPPRRARCRSARSSGPRSARRRPTPSSSSACSST